MSTGGQILMSLDTRLSALPRSTAAAPSINGRPPLECNVAGPIPAAMADSCIAASST